MEVRIRDEATEMERLGRGGMHPVDLHIKTAKGEATQDRPLWTEASESGEQGDAGSPGPERPQKQPAAQRQEGG